MQNSCRILSSVRIADILLFQSCLRNIADIFRNFYEMFHFSVEIFLIPLKNSVL